MSLTENEKILWNKFGQELWTFIQKEIKSLPMDDPMLSVMLIENAIDLFTETQCSIPRSGISQERASRIMRDLASQIKNKILN